MTRPKRKAFIDCKEKNKALQTRKRVKSNSKSAPNEIKINTQKCSVQLTPKDAIPHSMLNEKFIKQCSVKLLNCNIMPSNTAKETAKNCVYKSSKQSPKRTTPKRRRRQLASVKTTEVPEVDASVYDFIPGSQSSQASEDDSMIKRLKAKNNVRIIKGRQKKKQSNKNLHKSWNNTNITKAKKIINPKINKLSKMKLIEVLQNDLVCPMEKKNIKPVGAPSKNLNESILPLIEDVVADDDHFGDHYGDNDIINFEDENVPHLFNSNIENINPNPAPAKLKNSIEHVKPLVRTPLKPLNSQHPNRPRLSPQKGIPPLRNQLLRRLSLYNQTSPRTDSPRHLQINRHSPTIDVDGNTTNYFGFTSDLESESSSKNSIEHTSTPVKPTTKDTLIAKLKTLKSTVQKYSAIKATPKISTRPQRKTYKPIFSTAEDTPINFKDALSSTLLPAPITKKTIAGRTYSRRQNKYPENDQQTVDVNLFDNLISTPLEDTRIIALDDIPVPKKSPIKKVPARVYEKKKYQELKKKENEAPELTSFYQSFNKECQDVYQTKLIIE